VKGGLRADAGSGDIHARANPLPTGAFGPPAPAHYPQNPYAGLFSTLMPATFQEHFKLNLIIKLRRRHPGSQPISKARWEMAAFCWNTYRAGDIEA